MMAKGSAAVAIVTWLDPRTPFVEVGPCPDGAPRSMGAPSAPSAMVGRQRFSSATFEATRTFSSTHWS